MGVYARIMFGIGARKVNEQTLVSDSGYNCGRHGRYRKSQVTRLPLQAAQLIHPISARDRFFSQRIFESIFRIACIYPVTLNRRSR
jgi:hypothetical protein